MECPKCKSQRVVILNTNYPMAYECKDCKYVWLKSQPALVDE
ncbi:MAG: hypothetical protein QXX38_00705 [Candidatus Aenigmatarchaeota archaeon]